MLTYQRLQSKTILKHLLHYRFLFLVGTTLWLLWKLVTAQSDWWSSLCNWWGYSTVSFPTACAIYCMSRSVASIVTFDKLSQPLRFVGSPKIVWHISNIYGIYQILNLYIVSDSRVLDPGSKTRTIHNKKKLLVPVIWKL